MATIFFDMDGTIANFYGVENWLEYLKNENAYPYANAKPLVNCQALARTLNNLQKKGHKIEIISWLSKNSTEKYDEAVTEAKEKWLKTHLSSVHFDKINIVKYGTNKDAFRHTENDILFDDEEPNRKAWNGKAYNVNNILGILKAV